MSTRAPSRSEAARRRLCPVASSAYEITPPLLKGDFDGHPFRGNQYSDVASGGEGPTKRPSAQQEAIARGRAARLAAEAAARGEPEPRSEPQERGDGRTPEFRAWFKGSKAVDADGRPLTVFHGSFAIGIEEFDRSLGGAADDGIKTVDTVGSWFTTDERQAESIFSPGPNAAPDDGALYRVHLAVKNPRFLGRWEDVFVLADELGAKIPGKKGTESVDGDVLREKLIARGFDGLHIKGAAKIDGGKGDYWVAFHPNQIKATTNKAPTSKPSIHKGDLPGHPFRGNQWTQGMDGSGPASPHDEFLQRKAATITASVRVLSKRLGFNARRVVVKAGYGDRIKAIDGDYDTAGRYDPINGTITINAGNVSDPSLAQVGRGTIATLFAHEVAHARFEEARVSGKLTEIIEHPPTRILLAGTDGVTDYSRAWWDRAKSRPDLPGWTEGAINETLAEIHAAKANGFPVTISPTWQKVYDAMLKGSARPKKHKYDEYSPPWTSGLTRKGDIEGHPFRGNQWTDGASGGGDGDRTPEFKEWFGESKVVTADGKPLVVYHGTTEKDPSVLDESFEAGAGIFLTDNQSVADTFTLPREYGEPVFEDEDGNEIEAGTVVAAYVSMQNPLVISGREAQDVVDDTGLQGRTIRGAKENGHDGIILRGVMEGIGERYRSDNFIVFDPAQVKATGNKRPTKGPDLAKGDAVGHPFRGNQYTDGAGGGEAGDVNTEAIGAALAANTATAHDDAAVFHMRRRRELEAEGNLAAAEAHFTAQRAQRTAREAREALAAYDANDPRNNDPMARDALRKEADDLSAAARDASNEAVIVEEDEHDKATDAKVAKLIPLVGDTKEKLGYLGTVRVTGEEYPFMLDGIPRKAGGSANSDTGVITIYANQMADASPETLHSVLAHEVGHMEFAAAEERIQQERDNMDRRRTTDQQWWTDNTRALARQGVAGRFANAPDDPERDRQWIDNYVDQNAIQHPDGSLTTNGKKVYEKDYPIAYALMQMNGGEEGHPLDRLRREDGISEYSRAWWRELEAGKATYPQAVGETFAEIRASVRTGYKLEAVAKPAWQDYYALMLKLGTESLKRSGKET